MTNINHPIFNKVRNEVAAFILFNIKLKCCFLIFLTGVPLKVEKVENII